MNGKCVVVYKGKMGRVQLMLLFTCGDDVSCQVVYVQEKKALEKYAVRPVRQKAGWDKTISAL